MKLVRNVVHDLIEKRLWPVAVALVVALVAVPVVLGKSDAGTETAAVPSTPTPTGPTAHSAAAGGQVVSLEQQTTGAIARGGKVRNPFVQHHMPKAVDPAQAADTAVKATKDLVDSLSGSGSGSSSSSSSSNGGTSSDSTPTTPSSGGTSNGTSNSNNNSSSNDKSSSKATYSVNLKFGEAGAEKTYKNVARLTPLPSSTNPFFVFLGVSDDGKSAVFLVDADAVPSGDGTCQPSNDSCEQVELKKGDVEFFELQSGTAGVVQYQLELTSISKSTAATKASAARAHARESRAGREYLRQVVADNPDAVAGWDFSSKTGLLVQKDPVGASDVANVPAEVADEAAGENATTATPAFTAQP